MLLYSKAVRFYEIHHATHLNFGFSCTKSIFMKSSETEALRNLRANSSVSHRIQVVKSYSKFSRAYFFLTPRCMTVLWFLTKIKASKCHTDYPAVPLLITLCMFDKTVLHQFESLLWFSSQPYATRQACFSSVFVRVSSSWGLLCHH